MQGNHSTYTKTVATPKHFNAYGGATTRGSRSPTEVTLTYLDWVETFLPAFKAILSGKDKALSTMCSYNTLCLVDGYNETCPAPSHGTPACADHLLLTDTLRTQWGFDGYVIGDAGAIKFIQTDHEYASGQPEAAADALHAGADIALGGGCNPNGTVCESFGAVPLARSRGLLTDADVDTAVARILSVRFRLGLMDDPTLGAKNPYLAIPGSVVDSAPHRALALQASVASCLACTVHPGLFRCSSAHRALHGELRPARPLPYLVFDICACFAVVPHTTTHIRCGLHHRHSGENSIAQLVTLLFRLTIALCTSLRFSSLTASTRAI